MLSQMETASNRPKSGPTSFIYNTSGKVTHQQHRQSPAEPARAVSTAKQAESSLVRRPALIKKKANVSSSCSIVGIWKVQKFTWRDNAEDSLRDQLEVVSDSNKE